MSTMREVIHVIKETLLLNDKVERVATAVETLAQEVTDHERRLIRLEAQWDTALRLSNQKRIDN